MAFTDRLHNRGSISTGYDIDNSLKLEHDNSERLVRNSPVGTTVSVTNATVSYWVKRTELGIGTMYTWKGVSTWQNAAITNPSGYSDVLYVAGGNESYYKLVTNRVFRDTSAWYHIFIAYDTTQSTASDRIKIYINGVQETSFAVENYPSQNRDLEFLAGNGAWIFGWYETAASVAPCYLAEAYLFHDQTLAPTDFGEFDTDTGIWKPIEYTGSFSQYDWYYDFENSASLGADASGNGNNITYTYNITSADQALDTPTNNFCIQSAVATFRQKTPQTRHAADGGSASEDASVSNAWVGTICTVPLFKGKWYWEVQGQLDNNSMAGIHSFVGDTGTTTSPHLVDNCFACIFDGASGAFVFKHINGTTTSPVGGYETAFGDQSHVGIALDLDNSLMTYYVNGGSAGTNLTNIDISDITDIGDPVMPFVSIYRYRIRTNFGGYVETAWGTGETDANGYGNFKYSVPSGYYAICTKNLAEFG